MMRITNILALMMATGFLLASPAFAAQNQEKSPGQPSDRNLNYHSQPSMNFQAFHVNDLIGKEIKDQDGKSIGKVSDVLIGDTGRADFVVLSRGDLMKSEYTPVPYKMFISSAMNLADLREAKSVNTRLDKNQIDKAPTFSTSHFDINTSRGRICSYFGAQQCSNMG